MKVGLLIRVSTDEQVQHGTSLQNQEEAGRSLCQREGWDIFKVYRDDGYSGASLKRPGLQEMLNDAWEHKFNLLLVYKTDRLSRSLLHIVKIVLGELQGLGIAFKSIMEPYDTTTPAGRLFFAQLAMFADFERETIRERLRIGRRRKASEGKVMTAVPIFGYGRDAENNWIVNQEEAKVFQQVVHWIIDGKTTAQVVKRLNRRGIRNRFGRPWNRLVLLRIVKSPFYLGQGHYGGNKFTVPALISQTRHDLVLSRLRKNCHLTNPYPKHFFLLRGMVSCNTCGRHLSGRAASPKHHANYFCRYKFLEGGCRMPSPRQETIDSAVWDLVSRLVKDGNFLKRSIASSRLQDTSNAVILEAEVLALEKSLKDKHESLDRILALYAQSKELTVMDLDRQAGKIRSEIKEITRRRDEARGSLERHDTTRTAAAQAEQALRRARARIDSLNLVERREFLKTLVKVVRVSWDQKTTSHIIDVDFQIDITTKKTGKVESSQSQPLILSLKRKCQRQRRNKRIEISTQ